MTSLLAPIPLNEMERLISLSDLDLDYYSGYKDNFKDLTRLAATIAGTDISLINLIDSYTQWSVANHGLNVAQMPREDSVCQYTIMNDDFFEVQDLSADIRFKDKFYVVGDLGLRYYYGIPLKAPGGYNIGALCVLDKESTAIDPEKEELLKIIAGEIVKQLFNFKHIDLLKGRAAEAEETKRRAAHDIRGPVGGMVGLAQLLHEQGDENKPDEVIELAGLIWQSGKELLDLTDEILHSGTDTKAALRIATPDFTVGIFKEKLERLFTPQALAKNVQFTVTINEAEEHTAISKNKLLQITGNLISNAIKFTPINGKVAVYLDLKVSDEIGSLYITIKDTGLGMDEQKVLQIMNGVAKTTLGTHGEQGYGFGLPLVKHLIDELGGTINILSEPQRGTTFEVMIPVRFNRWQN